MRRFSKPRGNTLSHFPLCLVCVWCLGNSLTACNTPDGDGAGDVGDLRGVGDMVGPSEVVGADLLGSRDTLAAETLSLDTAVVTDAGSDGDGQPPAAPVCVPCEDDSDCVVGNCQAGMGYGRYCFEACETHSDCPTGWECYPLFPDQWRCIPLVFSCDVTCLVAGCPAGETCDQMTGECLPAKPVCSPCTQDWECAPGLRCNQVGNYCAPACDESQACPAHSTCREINLLIDNWFDTTICLTECPECCFGEACPCPTPCTGDTPYVRNGSCAHCLHDADCGPLEECDATGMCQAKCGPGFYPLEKDGIAVQCLEDQDCVCWGETVMCQVYQCLYKPLECDHCAAPLPACIQTNGTWSCVACSKDSDCPGGFCNLEHFTCVDEPGGCPEGKTCAPSCNQCYSDHDCASSGAYTPKCDLASMCCYDAGPPGCDGINLNCKGGMPCLSSEDFPANGDDPQPDPAIGGLCSCSEPMATFFFLPDCPQPPCFAAECPESSSCVDTGWYSSWFGGTPTEPVLTGVGACIPYST